MTQARNLKNMGNSETRKLFPQSFPLGRELGPGWKALVPIATLPSARYFHEGQGSRKPGNQKETSLDSTPSPKIEE